MNRWLQIRDEFSTWLRSFSLLTNIAQPSNSLEVIAASDAPAYLNAAFWAERTYEAEALAREQLTDPDIDQIFDEVAAVIDEDLRRFDPLVGYFARFFPDGDAVRIELERQVAHSVKRDLAWAAVERVICQPGFFTRNLAWYDNGRWPCNWTGIFPAGHVLVL